MKEKQSKRFRSEVEKGLFRIPITITKEMDEWLFDLSARMKASGGYKLPKSYILRALISAAMKLKIQVKSIKNEKDLEAAISEAIRRR